MARSLHPIAEHHNCKAFRCGKPALDRWLVLRAVQNQVNNVTRTRVLVDDAKGELLGFYSLSAAVLELDHLPVDLRTLIGIRYPAPAILLAQLAVHRDHHGHGLGKALLAHALQISMEAAERIGAMAVAVDAIDQEAQDFYQHFGFVPLAREGRHLFLDLSAIPTRLG